MVVAASSKDFGLFHFIPGEDGKDVIPHSLGIHSSATTENDSLSMMAGWQRKYFPSSFPKQLIWLGLISFCALYPSKGLHFPHGGISTTLSPLGGFGHHS